MDMNYGFKDQVKTLCDMVDNLMGNYVEMLVDLDVLESMDSATLQILQDSIGIMKLAEKISVDQAQAMDEMISNQRRIIELLEKKK